MPEISIDLAGCTDKFAGSSDKLIEVLVVAHKNSATMMHTTPERRRSKNKQTKKGAEAPFWLVILVRSGPTSAAQSHQKL
jgi:hypothetical protein